MLCVQRKTPDDGQRDCPKHVEFYSKNKFEELVYLVGFIIRSKQLNLFRADPRTIYKRGGKLKDLWESHFVRHLRQEPRIYL